jgi:hypothetical protein
MNRDVVAVVVVVIVVAGLAHARLGELRAERAGG